MRLDRIFRGVLAALLLALLLPEFARYRAEWLLSEANGRLADILRASIRGEPALRSADGALARASAATALLPGDPRPLLAQAIALLLRQRGSEAVTVLERALANGERPELTLNLGRARGVTGDAAGAQRAFLRTAWASPASIATLPAAMRGPLLDQVKTLEDDLRNGRLTAPPPL